MSDIWDEVLRPIREMKFQTQGARVRAIRRAHELFWLELIARHGSERVLRHRRWLAAIVKDRVEREVSRERARRN